jgi:hypothetical protein
MSGGEGLYDEDEVWGRYDLKDSKSVEVFEMTGNNMNCNDVGIGPMGEVLNVNVDATVRERGNTGGLEDVAEIPFQFNWV